MTRFQLVDVPVLMPGNCIICGSVGDDERKFVDIGITIEFIGTVYFCTHCMSEALNIMGFVSKEAYEAMRAEVKQRDETIQGLEHECSSLHRLVDAIDAIGGLSRSVEPSESATSDETPDDAGEPAERNKSELAKPSDGKRRKDVHGSGESAPADEEPEYRI